MGRVLAFDLDGQVIGTIRMMPMTSGLTLTEQLLARVRPDFRERWPGSWDAGRLVLAPEYRAGQDVLRSCLHLVVLHLMEHTDARYLLGSCTNVLGRLYRRMGFTFIGQNVPLPGTDKNYTLIHGPVPVVLDALAPPAPARAQPAMASAQGYY